MSTEPVAELTPHWNLVQVSNTDSIAITINKAIYIAIADCVAIKLSSQVWRDKQYAYKSQSSFVTIAKKVCESIV